MSTTALLPVPTGALCHARRTSSPKNQAEDCLSSGCSAWSVSSHPYRSPAGPGSRTSDLRYQDVGCRARKWTDSCAVLAGTAKGLSGRDFAVVYPIARGSGPMLVLASVALLGENPSLLGWIAVATTLSGVFIAGAGDLLLGTPDRKRHPAFSGGVHNRDFYWAFA